MDSVNTLLNDPNFHGLLSIIKAFRNGFVAGVKVRAPHALLMSLLFQSGPWDGRLKFIYKITKQHSLGLAKYAALYKAVVLAVKALNGGKSLPRSAETILGGMIGSWTIFGERNAVNEQIMLYVLSRVLVALLPRAAVPRPPSPPPKSEPGLPPRPFNPWAKTKAVNPTLARVILAASWGLGMWQFYEKRDHVQSGLRNSMSYIYEDSDPDTLAKRSHTLWSFFMTGQ